MHFAGRDIISIQDFTKEEILYVLECAKKMKAQPDSQLLSGKVMAACFFEPSTRTRLSFETAMQRQGGSVVGFADPGVTSTKKGETLSDTIRIVGAYSDVIVMRHPLDGAARRAAEATATPILNAGDGANQHPSQTFLDLFTILECQGTLDGLTVTFVGDLKYGRTVHSLVQALSHFDVSVRFVAPDSLQIPLHLQAELKRAGVPFLLSPTLEKNIPGTDILYMTRIQGERFADPQEYERVKNAFVLAAALLTGAKPTMKVLHPLPRVNELATDVDSTPHAYYFEQAANGVFVREALLALVLGKL